MRDAARRWMPLVLVAVLVLGLLWSVTWRVAEASPPGALEREGRFGLEALSGAGMKDDGEVSAGRVSVLVTAGAVHVSWVHLGVNSLAFVLVALLFWRATPPAERTFPRAAQMAAIALASSSAGFAASYLVKNGPSCGASAGIYGLLAAIAGGTWARRKELPENLRVMVPLALTLLSLATVLVFLGKPGMDHVAHFAGWGVGLLLGLAVSFRAGRVGVGVVGLGLAVLALV